MNTASTSLLATGSAPAAPSSLLASWSLLHKALAAALLLALILGLSLGLGLRRPAADAAPAPQYLATATLVINGSSAGLATFSQLTAASPVVITLSLAAPSLANPSGSHGLHIHAALLPKDAPLDSLCAAAGAHFNPLGVPHGCPPSPSHAGDLGSLATSGGLASAVITSTAISLVPNATNSVLYRALVLHADVDDCGLGGQPDSLTTGHSGARLICAVILPSLSAGV